MKITELCQCLEFLTCAQMLMHVSAHRHCIRVFTGSWLLEKNPLLHQGLEPTSVLCLAFQSTGRSCPTPLEARVLSWEWPWWSITSKNTIVKMELWKQEHHHENGTLEARTPSWKWNFEARTPSWKGNFEARTPSWKWNFGSKNTIMKRELWSKNTIMKRELWSKNTIMKMELWKQEHHHENGTLKQEHHHENGTLEARTPSWKWNFEARTPSWKGNFEARTPSWKGNFGSKNTIMKMELWITLEAGPPSGEQKQDHHHNNRTFGAISPS